MFGVLTFSCLRRDPFLNEKPSLGCNDSFIPKATANGERSIPPPAGQANPTWADLSPPEPVPSRQYVPLTLQRRISRGAGNLTANESQRSGAAAEYVPEKVKKAEKKLEDNPYDLDAWSILIREAQNQPIDKARKTYERLVAQFPSSGRFWKLYIEAEVKAKNYDKVEKLFQRCLMKVLHIDLWKCYVSYVRETKRKLPSYKEKMAQAYDFALDKIGMEIMSYPIWVDYINAMIAVCVASFTWVSSTLSVCASLDGSSFKVLHFFLSQDMNNAKLFSDEAANIYERAISTLLKKNMLLYFAYADYEESRMKYEKTHSIYNRLLAIEDIDPTLVYIQYMKFARRAEGIKSGRMIFKKAREDPRTRHHVYVTAALMEYYFSKDTSVAFKIFELGLKKYGDIPEYVLAYIDYLSHLNEDNNTRVLFERKIRVSLNINFVYGRPVIETAVRDDSLKSRTFPCAALSLLLYTVIEIWARFLAFESNIGDLASILKVEKRRYTAFKEEYEGKETALLVDRYKFMDLYPCSTSELKALGYKDVSRAKLAALIPDPVIAPSIAPSLKDDVDRKPEYPKPDTSQMIPFQPRHLAPPGLHPVPGGVFPVPPAAVILMKLLPPPICFQGPFVQVDEIMEILRRCKLPDTVEEAVRIITGSQAEMNMEGNGPVEVNTLLNKSVKRPNEDSDDEEEKGSVVPPVHDIYRTRQQKRIR
ncbi:cleavage stimulation factor subunit 3 [Xenopus tropicalis]|uniref:Cleavage stimulation factor subunit 3 n=1 Tax=Xenopus tropicalis TaxID=8364 RepID=A0A8J1JIW7_XENTR|nr:cleavage stimulation factor subunit 3 [Xenopus tropicalis]